MSLETLERLVRDDAFPQVLRPLKKTPFSGLPSLALTEPQAERLRAGRTIRVAPHMVKGPSVVGGPGAVAEPDVVTGPGVQGDGEEEDRTIRAMASGDVVALARLSGEELSPVRVFNTRTSQPFHQAVT